MFHNMRWFVVTGSSFESFFVGAASTGVLLKLQFVVLQVGFAKRNQHLILDCKSDHKYRVACFWIIPLG